ncbi:hypothetical protein ACBJ59_19430 [Nonomuraea sp. MTCD27]|uniref:hypothetical protein n=1 Tax=Nonomuraea sp. MTCD27 TaxID=1676747 RepID=UPI0035BFE703
MNDPTHHGPPSPHPRRLSLTRLGFLALGTATTVTLALAPSPATAAGPTGDWFARPPTSTAESAYA